MPRVKFRTRDIASVQRDESLCERASSVECRGRETSGFHVAQGLENNGWDQALPSHFCAQSAGMRYQDS